MRKQKAAAKKIEFCFSIFQIELFYEIQSWRIATGSFISSDLEYFPKKEKDKKDEFDWVVSERFIIFVFGDAYYFQFNLNAKNSFSYNHLESYLALK